MAVFQVSSVALRLHPAEKIALHGVLLHRLCVGKWGGRNSGLKDFREWGSDKIYVFFTRNNEFFCRTTKVFVANTHARMYNAFKSIYGFS